ncbi:rhomboid protease GluP [Sinomicrobium oceani]|uniref:Rhomboid protease GluP n=1 Tax=Sinomicrobium oceani TaxID=1150368 RepID=A0A1K1MR46_9FLAO|nr:hypothetical protein [Sinomicrobium oceani]SFW25591.1 rhomboid protease GluP [Sinomicrobium oceani]
MAFGFPPKHIQEIQIGDMKDEYFLIVAIETVFDLGWKVLFIDETGFIARTKFSWRSWIEEVNLEINDGTATIKSECAGSQFLDWGKNKKNVMDFLAACEEVKSKLTPEEIEDKLADLRKELKKMLNDPQKM